RASSPGYSPEELANNFRVASDPPPFTPGRDRILFGQADVSPTFSDSSPFTRLVEENGAQVRRGMSIEEVASELRAGRVSPDALRVDVINVNGEWITVNNRSLTTLSAAGMEPTNVRVLTPATMPTTGPDNLTSVLNRLQPLGGEGSTQSWVRTAGNG